MAYNNNVPQANQTIASSQGPILGNFQFIQTDLQVEHQFNGNIAGQAEGTHIQASMPNIADPNPLALPAGTNGVYYVGNSDGSPKFCNAAFGVQFIQTVIGVNELANFLTGTVSLNASSYTTITALPNSSVGAYWLMPPGGTDPNSASAVGFFVTRNNLIKFGNDDPGIKLQGSALNFQAEVNSSAFAGTYKYFIIYWTP